jgi:hypothetical protein
MFVSSYRISYNSPNTALIIAVKLKITWPFSNGHLILNSIENYPINNIIFTIDCTYSF